MTIVLRPNWICGWGWGSGGGLGKEIGFRDGNGPLGGIGDGYWGRALGMGIGGLGPGVPGGMR